MQMFLGSPGTQLIMGFVYHIAQTFWIWCLFFVWVLIFSNGIQVSYFDSTTMVKDLTFIVKLNQFLVWHDQKKIYVKLKAMCKKNCVCVCVRDICVCESMRVCVSVI